MYCVIAVVHVSLGFLAREGNSVAHMLTKYGRFVEDYLVWLKNELDYLSLDVISIDN